jgi:hypothetical protein
MEGFVLTFSTYDEYHEFKHLWEVMIEKWWLHWSPNYVSIIKVITILSGMLTIPSVNLASGNKSANGGGPTWSGGTSLSIGTWDLLSMFNPIVKFF